MNLPQRLMHFAVSLDPSLIWYLGSLLVLKMCRRSASNTNLLHATGLSVVATYHCGSRALLLLHKPCLAGFAEHDIAVRLRKQAFQGFYQQRRGKHIAIPAQVQALLNK